MDAEIELFLRLSVFTKFFPIPFSQLLFHRFHIPLLCHLQDMGIDRDQTRPNRVKYGELSPLSALINLNFGDTKDSQNGFQ